MAPFGQLATNVSLALASSLLPGALAAGEESILNSEIGRLNNQSLLWGPYRPNLYFGVRPRIPKALMTGLMWANVDGYDKLQNDLRYTCEQNEGMAGYGWDEFDTRKGGIQRIHDAGNMIDITTSFVKVPGGAHGGSWAARIKGTPRDDAPEDLKTTMLLFVSQENEGGDTLAVPAGDNIKGFEGDVTIQGQSEALGGYKVVVTKGTGDHPDSDHPFSEFRDLEFTVVQSVNVQDNQLWQAKNIALQAFKQGIDFVLERYGPEKAPPPSQVYQLAHQPGQGNAHMVQKVFQGAFEFDVLFSSASAGHELTSSDLTREIKSTAEAFGERFSSVFSFKAPFTAEKYHKFGRSMFSNLIGGIGYFYGKSVTDRSHAPEYDEDNEGFWEETAQARARHQEQHEGPYELFTSVPSRPFFPRGFLWDEGFHLLPIADWDIDLTLEVVKSWFNLMDEDGWIGREQILGDEARSKVPQEFQVQYPHYANPPTLFFILDAFIEKLHKRNSSSPETRQGVSIASAHIENPEVGLEYLRNLYPLLQRQYAWFRKTQAGDIKSYDREAYSTKEAYRWRGRTVAHILTSGLDDYPRPQPPHPGELHVDLMSWMGLMTKSLINIAGALDHPEDVDHYSKILDAIEHNLDDLHWSEQDKCYCDATIDEYEEHKLVCHKGYISLFPFLTGLVKPDSDKLGKVLDLIADESELFSPHGIRSLSKKDPFYGTEENYWRSPVWMPINYLILKELHNTGSQEGQHRAQARTLFNKLRKNLVDTVYASWVETGFAWEQYDPDTGKGQRTQHFTGWTSLVVKIMTMAEFEETGSAHGMDEL